MIARNEDKPTTPKEPENKPQPIRFGDLSLGDLILYKKNNEVSMVIQSEHGKTTLKGKSVRIGNEIEFTWTYNHERKLKDIGYILFQ